MLARVGQAELTEEDLARQVARARRVTGAEAASAEVNKTLLDGLIRFELLSQEAERRGLMSDPEVVHVARQQAVAKLLQMEVGEVASPQAISAEDVRAFYEKNRDALFSRPAAVRVWDLAVRDEKQAHALALKAKSNPRDVEAFSALVRAHGKDAALMTSEGDRGYLDSRSAVPEPLLTAALSSPGEGIVGPIDTHDGYFHVLRVGPRRAAVVQGLAEVETVIRHQIERSRRDEAMESLLERLRAKSPVQILSSAPRP